MCYHVSVKRTPGVTSMVPVGTILPLKSLLVSTKPLSPNTHCLLDHKVVGLLSFNKLIELKGEVGRVTLLPTSSFSFMYYSRFRLIQLYLTFTQFFWKSKMCAWTFSFSISLSCVKSVGLYTALVLFKAEALTHDSQVH